MAEIRLSDIQKRMTFEEPIEALTLELGYQYTANMEPTTLELDIWPSGTHHLLKGRFLYRAQIPCSRCLERVALSGEGRFEAEYCPCSEEPRSKEIVVDAGNDHFVFYEDDLVLAEDLVSQQMYLEIPDKLLCRESCKGLCPSCGVNLNHEKCTCVVESDDRWGPLSLLKAHRKE